MSLESTLREKFQLKTAEQKRQDDLVAECDSIHNQLTRSRRKAEYEWWLNDQMIAGEQYVAFDRVAGSIMRVNTKLDNKLVINLIKKNARYVVMWLNRDHPQAKIKPGSDKNDVYMRCKANQHYLDYLYEYCELNKKYKQITWDAYKYKVGAMKILWNKNALAPTAPYTYEGLSTDQGYGEVMLERIDPFELYWDPLAYDIESCRYIEHVIPRTMGEVQNNPLYMNRDKVTADNKLASSFLKEAQIRAQTNGGVSQIMQEGAYATVLVRELFKREFIDGKWKIHLVVTTNGGVLLRDEIWSMNFYPFEFYLADVQGKLLDGGAPVRDLRSPQRAYNQFMSLVQENGRLMAKINWRMPRNANVNVITDEVGQFLEFDPTPGGAPEQTTVAGLPSYVENHLVRLANDLDTLAGNHSASYGKSPGSKASGELVNRLQEGDSNNLLLMRDNLDDFQARVMKKALLTFKASAPTDRQIRSRETNELGQYDFETFTPDMVEISDQVVVTSGSNMPYSLADRQEFLLNMKDLGVLTNEQFIKALNNPDLEAATKTDDADIARALQENKQLLKGEILGPPAKQEDHNTHIQVHTMLVKSNRFMDATVEIKNNIEAHIQDHINISYMLQQISNSLNVEPIKRSESVTLRPTSFLDMTPQERTQFLSKFAVQSDTAEIVARGGLNVQKPDEAEAQAINEDNAMLDGTPRSVGLTDNHQVHIQTHSAVMATEGWKTVPEPIKNIFETHIKDHITALSSMTPTPGLMPRTNGDIPATNQIFKNKQPKPPLTDAGPGKIGTIKNPPAQASGLPVDQAARNPKDKTPRPLMPHEMIQHQGAVENQRATEKMHIDQAAAKEREAKAVKPKPKGKTLSKR